MDFAAGAPFGASIAGCRAGLLPGARECSFFVRGCLVEDFLACGSGSFAFGCAPLVMPGMFIGIDCARTGLAVPTSAAAKKRLNRSGLPQMPKRRFGGHPSAMPIMNSYSPGEMKRSRTSSDP
jgi:hypothetical protein